ncbi:MAG TPA: histidine ammonia-lyase [Bacteroidia bacterium]|jgi:histidine ammonia-lyase|nr:histidine ammonia-lyase [Bacteroidia bacterium]
MFLLDPRKYFTLADAEKVVTSGEELGFSEAAIKNIKNCRIYLDKKLATQNEAVYGINTGFGSLCNVVIPKKDLEQLQENLVKSHACGMGEEVPRDVIKIMLLLKIRNFIYGKSAVSIETAERMLFFYNNDILPVIYQQGSLGASGDLAPLAHLTLPLIGLGEVYYKGKKITTEQLYKNLKLKPVKLQSKEGLALLNGTQFMSAYAVWCLIKSNHLNKLADLTGSIALDGFFGRTEPFCEAIQNVRPHKGQIETGRAVRNYLKGSKIAEKKKETVQDPYSFRCIPQVHGATKDVVRHVTEVIETEINSVTDNPTIFPENDEIISGGNFHGQPLAMALDYLAIAISELGSISERRIYQLISGARNLPPFLVANPGINSGFMIPQYTAASIVSQSKQLCSPASVDSIVSSNGQEDHVSMGANGATKCYKVIENTYKILAIEFMNATQALEFRRPLKSSPLIEKTVAVYRKNVAFIENDKLMHNEINKSLKFVESLNLE